MNARARGRRICTLRGAELARSRKTKEVDMKLWMVMGLLAVAACGGSNGSSPDGGQPSPTGPGSMTGTVGGRGLVVKDAVFAILTSGSASGAAVVALADRTGLCGALASNPAPTGSTVTLEFGLANVGASGLVPLANGAYTFLSSSGGLSAPGRYWLLGTFQTFDGCAVVPESIVEATAGTVTVTQVGTTSGSNLQGSFSMGFGSDSVSGTVNATYCAALETATCGLLLRQLPDSPELRTSSP